MVDFPIEEAFRGNGTSQRSEPLAKIEMEKEKVVEEKRARGGGEPPRPTTYKS